MERLRDNFNGRLDPHVLAYFLNENAANEDIFEPAAEKAAETKREYNAVATLVGMGNIQLNDDGSLSVGIIVNAAVKLKQLQALDAEKKAKEQAFINQVLREFDTWFEAHLNLMSDLMNKIEDKQREIDEARRMQSSYEAARNADSLDKLTDRQRADVMRGLAQYTNDTGRTVNLDNKAERDRALEFIMLANEMDIAHKCGEQEDLINAYDKASAEYDEAWQAAKEAGYENKSAYEQRNELYARQEKIEINPSQPTGVDGEIAIFMQEFAELEKSGIRPEDVQYLLENASKEAQKDIKAIPEVQKYLNPPKTEPVLEAREQAAAPDVEPTAEQEETKPTTAVGFDFG